MPPKDMQNPGTLMFSTDGGEALKPLGKVTDIDMELCGDEEIADDYYYIPSNPEEITFSVKNRIHLNVMRILIGCKDHVPNNWLKMHGYPMRRRKK